MAFGFILLVPTWARQRSTLVVSCFILRHFLFFLSFILTTRVCTIGTRRFFFLFSSGVVLLQLLSGHKRQQKKGIRPCCFLGFFFLIWFCPPKEIEIGIWRNRWAGSRPRRKTQKIRKHTACFFASAHVIFIANQLVFGIVLCSILISRTILQASKAFLWYFTNFLSVSSLFLFSRFYSCLYTFFSFLLSFSKSHGNNEPKKKHHKKPEVRVDKKIRFSFFGYAGREDKTDNWVDFLLCWFFCYLWSKRFITKRFEWVGVLFFSFGFWFHVLCSTVIAFIVIVTTATISTTTTTGPCRGYHKW